MKKNDERLGKQFHLVDSLGGTHIPVKLKNRESGVVSFRLHRRGTGGNTKANGMREIHDEREAFELAASGSWGIRTFSPLTEKEGIRYLGVNVRDVRWTGSEGGPNNGSVE